MEKYKILLAYTNKQLEFINRIYEELVYIDLSNYEKRFVFALRSQQFYTAIEDLLKQTAKAFENHIEMLGNYHKELLIRMNMEIPNMRPMVISKKSFEFLDKLRAFRHFIRHAYDCELKEQELLLIQQRVKNEFTSIQDDLEKFRQFVQQLAN